MATRKKSPSRKKASKKKSAAKKSGASEVAVKKEKALAPFEELEQMFDNLLQKRWPSSLAMDFPRWSEFSDLLDRQSPKLDIVNRDDEVVVRAEVPGIDRDDIELSLADRTLTIKGSSRSEEKEEKDEYFRQEIKTGQFSRSVLLPADVNASRAKAEFSDGVLEVHLPKVRATKRQTITVK